MRGEKRVVLRLHPRLAPIKVAVLPLSKKDELLAREPRGGRHAAGPLAGGARRHPVASAAATAARTRSARPSAVTVDFDSLQDQAVTIRERDTMEQVRVPIAGLVETLQEKFAGRL